MTQRADVRNGDSFSVKARGESERRIIQDFKKLSAQDGIDATDLFFESLSYLFKTHNWPPGNQQLLLERFQQDVKPVLPCKCGRPAVKVGVHLTSKVERSFCAKCFSDVPARHDAKVWRFTDATKEKANQGRSQAEKTSKRTLEK